MDTIPRAIFSFKRGEYTAEVTLPMLLLFLSIGQKVVLGPSKGSQSIIMPTCFLFL
jgi:hypothetical protein